MANPIFNSTTMLSINELTPYQLYERLEHYYENNDLYNQLGLYNSIGGYYGKFEKLRPIRTVVHRSVEFFVSKIAPKEVVISAKSDTVKKAIEQILKWSNFNGQKSKYVRHLSLYGDLFLKVVSDTDKVYIEEIEAEDVTKIECDHRGNVSEIRIDIKMCDDKGKDYWYTEYWSKPDGYMAIWEHQFGRDEDISKLGDPKEFYPLAFFGIDFVPFVHIKFQDMGDERGLSCVAHAMQKIDEANREATRLTDLLFRYNKPIWATSSDSVDKTGRPVPALKLGAETTLEDDSIISLPGTYKMDSLIPNINYTDALNILNAMMEEINRDLPELRYYDQIEANSGKQVTLMLAGAIDRAEESRGNFITGLKKITEMAITIAQFMGFIPRTIGKYDNGDFEATFELGEMFAMSPDEKATTLKTLTDAGMPLESAMKFLGFSDVQIKEAVDAKLKDETAKQNALANSLLGDSFNTKP